MKIIHSFWSKPTLEKGNWRHEDRRKGGWYATKYSYMSWALSCLLFNKHYGSIELYTDQKGKELLVDLLGLPYGRVHVVLDSLNHYHPDLWAVSKLFTYQLQDDPFLHVDNDVFVWKKLNRIADAGLVAQNEDVGYEYYQRIWHAVTTHFSYIPDYMKQDFQKHPEIRACNAGVFGGQDVDFIKEFASEALAFIKKNKKHHHQIILGFSVLIYEQYLFACLARARGKSVSYLFPQMSADFKEVGNFAIHPRDPGFIHTVGSMKKKEYISDCVSRQLRLEFPDYYYRIEELINTYYL